VRLLGVTADTHIRTRAPRCTYCSDAAGGRVAPKHNPDWRVRTHVRVASPHVAPKINSLVYLELKYQTSQEAPDDDIPRRCTHLVVRASVGKLRTVARVPAHVRSFVPLPHGSKGLFCLCSLSQNLITKPEPSWRVREGELQGHRWEKKGGVRGRGSAELTARGHDRPWEEHSADGPRCARLDTSRECA
jgi:hypothetical protein